VRFTRARKEGRETRPVIRSAIVVGNQRFPSSNLRVLVVRLVVRDGEISVPRGYLRRDHGRVLIFFRRGGDEVHVQDARHVCVIYARGNRFLLCGFCATGKSEKNFTRSVHLTCRPTRISLFRGPTQKFLHSRACAFVRASLPPIFYFQKIVLRKVSSSGLRRRRPCLLRFRAGVFGARGRLRKWIPRRCLYLFANKSRARRRPI